MGLLFTSAKSRASFCHFYVVINQLGLFARSVQSTNLLPDILYVCLCYVMLTGVPSGGCSHGDDTANNPIKKECSFKSLDICIHTHRFYFHTGSCLGKLQTSVAFRLLRAKLIALVSV